MVVSERERDWMWEIAKADDENLTAEIAMLFEKRSKELGIRIPEDRVPMWRRRRAGGRTGSGRAVFMAKIDKESGL